MDLRTDHAHYVLSQRSTVLRKNEITAVEGVIRDFKIQQHDNTDGNENVRKTIALISKTTTSHVHHAFFVHSCPAFPRLRRENA